jgi:acyl-CoA dehydrogenase
MDFDLSESQKELAALTRRILDDQVTQPRLRAVSESGVLFDRDLWRTLADAGVIAAALPESIGGGGLDFLEQCTILIEIGRAVAPVPYLTSVLAAAAIGYFGTDEQRTRWASPAAAGELVLTAALAEEFVDSPESPQTRAERTDAGWRLEGSKAVVPYATVVRRSRSRRIRPVFSSGPSNSPPTTPVSASSSIGRSAASRRSRSGSPTRTSTSRRCA